MAGAGPQHTERSDTLRGRGQGWPMGTSRAQAGHGRAWCSSSVGCHFQKVLPSASCSKADVALSVQGCEAGLACAAQEGACAFGVPGRGASPGACPAATLAPDVSQLLPSTTLCETQNLGV